MNSVQITTQPLIVEHDRGETHYTLCVVGNANSRSYDTTHRTIINEMHDWCNNVLGAPRDYDTMEILWHRSYMTFAFRNPQHATLFIVTFQGREY